MQKISFVETVNPATLDPNALAEFCRQLYAVHCQIFDGVDAAQFEKKMVSVNAKWTKIRVFKNIKREAVGYCALHAYDKVINSENIVVFRAETGILTDYRKQGNVCSFFLTEAIKFKVLHPFQKSYLFCTLVHPSSYHLISKFFFRFYPNINYATPSEILDRMYQIADAFHEVPVSNLAPLLREVGWITRQTADEQSAWASSRDPASCFFLKKNPGYGKGQGLVTLVPLHLLNILLSSLIVSYYSLIYSFLEKRRTGRE